MLQGPIAILLALLLNRKMRGQSLIRVLIFVPYVIAEVIVGTGFSLMLATNGAVNGFLEKVGLGWLAQDWLSDPSIAIWTLMAILTWKYIGLRRHPLPRRTPGDSRRSCTRRPRSTARPTGRSSGRITLPLLGPTLRIWAFLSIIGALQLFDLVYIIWGQYVSSVAGTIDDGDLHGRERAQLRQLRIRQRRRRRHLRHLAGRSP